MSFETDLRSRAALDPTISGIVGTRIYWRIRPQNSVLPALVLGTVYGDRSQTMDGPAGTYGNRIQWDCMASTKEQAVALRDAVIDLIEGSGSAGATEFQGGFVNLHRDLAEDTASGVVRTEQVDSTIWFN